MVALEPQLNRGSMECVDVRAPHPSLVGVGWRIAGATQIRNIQRKMYRWLVWKLEHHLSFLDVNLSVGWTMGRGVLHARESCNDLLNCSLTFCRNWALIFCSAASASSSWRQARSTSMNNILPKPVSIPSGWETNLDSKSNTKDGYGNIQFVLNRPLLPM